jgi:hypothetical protein
METQEREDSQKLQAQRGKSRIAPLEMRAYYTRAEMCAAFGLSSKRLQEAIKNDPNLPMVRNGRNQLFPKVPAHDWYAALAARRANVHYGETRKTA